MIFSTQRLNRRKRRERSALKREKRKIKSFSKLRKTVDFSCSFRALARFSASLRLCVSALKKSETFYFPAEPVYIFICLCLATTMLNADSVGTPAGLLDFSKKIPIELDETSSQIIKQDSLSQIERNKAIAKTRNFPWDKLFLATLAGLFILGIIKFSKSKEKPVIDTLKTSKIKANESLEKLTKDPKIRYETLTNILREYLEEGYGIKTKAKTTNEFLEVIKDDQHLPKDSLKQLLVLADLVKFGKEKPTPADIDKAYSFVQQIINQ